MAGMNDTPTLPPSPPLRERGSLPSNWFDDEVARARAIFEVAAQSEWFPVLFVVLCALALVWATARLRRGRENPDPPGLVTRTGKNGRTCKWARDPVKRDGGMERWQCRTCGVDAFTTSGKPPVECKRALREAQL